MSEKEKPYSGEQFANWRNTTYGGNGKCALQEEGKATIYKVPILAPDWSIFMQISNPNSHSLIDPNSTVLVGWLSMFWLVSINANEDIAAQFYWTGHVSAHWWKNDTGSSFIKVGSDNKNAV